MRLEIIVVAATLLVGGAAGWLFAAPRDPPLVASTFQSASKAPGPPASEPTAEDPAREAVKDEALVAAMAFQAHPCHPAFRARWLVAEKAYMRGWYAGRGEDGQTGPDWKSTKDQRIGMAFNDIHDKDLITDAEFADITIGVSPEGAQMLASTPAPPRPAALPERAGCKGSEPSRAVG